MHQHHEYSAPPNVSRPTSARTESAPQRAASAVIERVWARLSSIYGSQFTASFGDNPHSGAANDWAEGLAGLNRRQIDRGLKACFARTSKFAPNLPEFRVLCIGTDKPEEVQETPEQTAARLLARDESDLAHFRESNRLWREAGHNDDLFDIPRCFNHAQRRALGIEP